MPIDRRARAVIRDREAGFGVLEMIIVVAIIAILLSMLMLSGRGAKKAGHFRAASGAALQYGEAIDAYMADHGQTPPVLGAANQWPVAQAGPVDPLMQGNVNGFKPYMKSVPEPVTNGSVAFGSAGPDAQATITYTVTGRTYQLLVRVLDTSPVTQCVVTNGVLPSGVQKCA